MRKTSYAVNNYVPYHNVLLFNGVYETRLFVLVLRVRSSCYTHSGRDVRACTNQFTLCSLLVGAWATPTYLLIILHCAREIIEAGEKGARSRAKVVEKSAIYLVSRPRGGRGAAEVILNADD